MFVLSRRPSEFINITVPPSDKPQSIAVCLVSSSQRQSKIGFVADNRQITINRREVEELSAADAI